MERGEALVPGGERRKNGRDGAARLPLRPQPPRPRPRYPVGGQVVCQWVRIDAGGGTSLISVDRHKLTQELGVQMRDLRLLDPKSSTNPSAILPRDRALVVALESIKAVITQNYVIVNNPGGEGAAPLVRELEARLGKTATGTILGDLVAMRGLSAGGGANGNGCRSPDGFDGFDGEQQGDVTYAMKSATPFELKALEVCLESICSTLDELTTELEAVAFPALDALTVQVTTHNLQRVRSLKSRMVRLKTRVETVREMLEKFLEDDDDMRSLNLTAKQQAGLSARKQNRSSMSHQRRVSDDFKEMASDTDSQDEDLQEVEMLLEAYFMQTDNTLNRLQTLCEYIDDTEDYINIEQDKHRNQLLQLELLMSAGTFALAFVAVISGIFGMNLKNDDEGDNTTFILVSVISSMGAVVIFALLILFCRWKGLMFN
ncbi:unnamed protein product [Ostreobium quekettii]|uniref:Magnesium transporter n=1 Tax=Ostreobium quekettii TaxID=121088 RepID=A0A8S1JA96_9CHLO|nr:unnamed protein product [Ostreobium quekettii]|eukprot:evm.model.scf_739.1 EVM.evm.TU.scf_739.1   scf_739:5099-10665(-)